MDLSGEGDPYNLLLTEPLLSIVDNSLHHSKYLLAPASIAFRHASTCFNKLSAAFASCFSRVTAPSSNSFPLLKHSITTATRSIHLHPPCFSFPHASFAALFGHRISTFSLNSLFRAAAADNIQPLPLLSLAAAFIPPFDHLNTGMLAIPSNDTSQDTNLRMLGSLDKSPCNVQHRDCVSHTFSELNCSRHIVEPKTGIEFPGVLNSILAKDSQSNLLSEVLVGTGSRIMTIIKIKSLKVYAFGFYVHRSSVCQKLGSKYSSVPVAELKERNDFYADLLREDIGMTLRLVVNHNGMKINTVKGAFEKALRARLAKTSPETDFKCITAFGSYFTKDIPLPVGTVIDFRRTPDGQLITEIGGNQIGAVRSKELCRAFFDMYIGEIPVSEQTKEEIGRNVATMIRRC